MHIKVLLSTAVYSPKKKNDVHLTGKEGHNLGWSFQDGRALLYYCGTNSSLMQPLEDAAPEVKQLFFALAFVLQWTKQKVVQSISNNHSYLNSSKLFLNSS